MANIIAGFFSAPSCIENDSYGQRTDGVVCHLAVEHHSVADHCFAAVISWRFHLQDNHVRRCLFDTHRRLPRYRYKHAKHSCCNHLPALYITHTQLYFTTNVVAKKPYIIKQNLNRLINDHLTIATLTLQLDEYANNSNSFSANSLQSLHSTFFDDIMLERNLHLRLVIV